ncbi:MAG: ABC transporter substrate-binding protein [Dehalococcoidia bacterium]|nr:ABC transporter substrate-binding protein [Dehalococcoidia bacterium]
MTDVNRLSSMVPGRRAVLRGGLLGAAGLASAALFGCKTTPQEAPAASSGGGAAANAGDTKRKLLNQDLLALNDPNLPLSYIIEEPDTTRKKGGTFREAWYNDFTTWDPVKSSSVTTLRVPNDVGERLLNFKNNARVNPFTMDTEPLLARSWETSPDGLTITFKLTDKAKFHNKPPVNGRAFTAEDVKKTFERARTTAGSVSKGYFDSVDTMTAVNATTFQVKFKAPQPDFMTLMAVREMVIYPIEIADNGFLDKNTDAIGTGAYILTSAKKSDHIKYVRNPDYWQPDRPYIDNIDIKMVPDGAARLAAVRVGQYDYAATLVSKRADAEALKKSSPELHVTWNASAGAVGSIMTDINLKNPKWADERIRQAMNLGMNRPKYIATLFEGLGIENIRSLPWAAVFDKRPASQAELGPYLRFDPAEAKKLLLAAGQESFSFEWRASPVYATGSEQTVAFQIANWKDIGVTVKPVIVDGPTLASQYNTNQFAEASTGVLIRYTTDNFYKDMLKTGGSLNRSSLSDPQIDQWADQQSTEVNPQKRRETLRKIWDYMGGPKQWRTFENAAGQGPQAVWSSSLRNFSAIGTLNSAIASSDMTMYVKDSWFDKDNPSIQPKTRA